MKTPCTFGPSICIICMCLLTFCRSMCWPSLWIIFWKVSHEFIQEYWWKFLINECDGNIIRNMHGKETAMTPNCSFLSLSHPPSNSKAFPRQGKVVLISTLKVTRDKPSALLITEMLLKANPVRRPYSFILATNNRWLFLWCVQCQISSNTNTNDERQSVQQHFRY